MPVYSINKKRLQQIISAKPNTLITLYTLQHPRMLKTALWKGYLSGDHKFTNKDFVEGPYIWMREQMAKRLSSFSGEFPIWCHLGVIQPVATKLRIKLKVPRERILFSNYCQWEDVLNYFPVTSSKEEYEKLEDLYPIGGFNSLDEVHKDIKDSWNKIFDIKYDTVKYNSEKENYDHYDATQVQACVDRVKISDIVDVVVKYDSMNLSKLGV